MRKREPSKKKNLIQETVKPADTKFSGLDRINSIPDYTKKVKANFLADIIFQYSLMSPDELIKASKDKNITVLERQVIVQLVDSVSKSKGAARSREMSHDRISGKATNKVEHSGPDGAPIDISNSQLVNGLGSMTRDELLKIKKAVTLVKAVKDSKDEAEKE